MKRLSEDVEEFYRLRVIVTFRSGRTHMDTYGPFTSHSKAKEIRTRVSRGWDFLWHKSRQPPFMMDDNRSAESIRYIIEFVPGIGWYSKSDDTYTAD